jgi:hypothetical protein
MVNYKLVLMPMGTQAKVFIESGPHVADLTHFRSLIGALQYLTFTCPNIVYVV